MLASQLRLVGSAGVRVLQCVLQSMLQCVLQRVLQFELQCEMPRCVR